jgi:hypothetical protein
MALRRSRPFPFFTKGAVAPLSGGDDRPRSSGEAWKPRPAHEFSKPMPPVQNGHASSLEYTQNSTGERRASPPALSRLSESTGLWPECFPIGPRGRLPMRPGADALPGTSAAALIEQNLECAAPSAPTFAAKPPPSISGQLPSCEYPRVSSIAAIRSAA